MANFYTTDLPTATTTDESCYYRIHPSERNRAATPTYAPESSSGPPPTVQRRPSGPVASTSAYQRYGGRRPHQGRPRRSVMRRAEVSFPGRASPDALGAARPIIEFGTAPWPRVAMTRDMVDRLRSPPTFADQRNRSVIACVVVEVPNDVAIVVDEPDRFVTEILFGHAERVHHLQSVKLGLLQPFWAVGIL